MNNLATVSLTNPVKIFVNTNKDIAFNLQQEFIRIRPHMEADREAVVSGIKVLISLFDVKSYLFKWTLGVFIGEAIS